MTLAELAMLGLATWRVSALLVYEDGPWAVFTRLRTLIGIPPEGGRIEGFLPLLFSCIWCISPWVAVVVWGLWWLQPAIPAILAASAFAIAWDRWVAERR